MRIIEVDFYKEFKCIADKCTDTCCAGWGVDVDSDTMEKYNAIPGEFGNYIRSNIGKVDGCDSFVLKEHKRCPMLNGNNLCELILRGGEDMLCEICQNHPRFFEWYADIEERGIGLSCEVACKLLLERDSLISFDIVDDGNVEENVDKYKMWSAEYFLKSRQDLWDIVNDHTIERDARINKLIDCALACDDELCYDSINDQDCTSEYYTPEYYKLLLNVLKQMESIDGIWTDKLDLISWKLDDLIAIEDSFENGYNEIEWSNVLCYIMFRHLSKYNTEHDGIYELTMFSLDCMAIINLLNKLTVLQTGKLTMDDKLYNLKLWSKQVEYSEDNTDLLFLINE